MFFFWLGKEIQRNIENFQVNVTHNPTVETNAADKYRLATFRTKESPIMGIHFTRRNLLLAFGPYVG